MVALAFHDIKWPFFSSIIMLSNFLPQAYHNIAWLYGILLLGAVKFYVKLDTSCCKNSCNLKEVPLF